MVELEQTSFLDLLETSVDAQGCPHSAYSPPPLVDDARLHGNEDSAVSCSSSLTPSLPGANFDIVRSAAMFAGIFPSQSFCADDGVCRGTKRKRPEDTEEEYDVFSRDLSKTDCDSGFESDTEDEVTLSDDSSCGFFWKGDGTVGGECLEPVRKKARHADTVKHDVDRWEEFDVLFVSGDGSGDDSYDEDGDDGSIVDSSDSDASEDSDTDDTGSDDDADDDAYTGASEKLRPSTSMSCDGQARFKASSPFQRVRQLVLNLVSKKNRKAIVTCPDTCSCKTGNSFKVPPIPRKSGFHVAAPLYRKLLKQRALRSCNLQNFVCCDRECCYSWKRVSRVAMVQDYRESDLRTYRYSWGDWEEEGEEEGEDSESSSDED